LIYNYLFLLYHIKRRKIGSNIISLLYKQIFNNPNQGNFVNQKKIFTLMAYMLLSIVTTTQLVVASDFWGTYRHETERDMATGRFYNFFEKKFLADAIKYGSVEAVRDAAYEARKSITNPKYPIYVDSSYPFELIHVALEELRDETNDTIVTEKLAALQDQLNFLETLKNAHVNNDLRDAILFHIASNSAILAFVCKQVDVVGTDFINDLMRVFIRNISADITCLEKEKEDNSRSDEHRKYLSQAMAMYKKAIPHLKSVSPEISQSLHQELETKYNNASCARKIPSGKNVRCSLLAEFVAIAKR
jgi:hypothetical protein